MKKLLNLHRASPSSYSSNELSNVYPGSIDLASSSLCFCLVVDRSMIRKRTCFKREALRDDVVHSWTSEASCLYDRTWNLRALERSLTAVEWYCLLAKAKDSKLGLWILARYSQMVVVTSTGNFSIIKLPTDADVDAYQRNGWRRTSSVAPGGAQSVWGMGG